MTFKTILALATGLTMFAVPALAADTKPQIGTFGFDVAGMDTSVKAGDDFVGHTAGKYMAALEIPADKTNFGMFTKLRDLSQERTRTIIEKAAASGGAPGSEASDAIAAGETGWFVAARTKYKAYIATMLGLAGYDNAAARAEGIFALETAIAKTHWTRVERRQAEKTYNPVPVAELPTRFAGLDWSRMIAGSSIPVQGEVIIATPSAIEGTAKVIAAADLNVLKDYMAFHTIRDAAAFLPKAFVDANFDMYSKTLGGQPEQAPRWKRGVDITSGVLGEALGKPYVAEYFPPEAKAKADALVKNIIAAMDARLANLAWMDPKTRVAAREKLAAFTPKIGYPDKWEDYSALTIVRGDAMGNAKRATEFEFNESVAKLNKPVDRSEWFMTPMTVNAYANPTWNEIVFPAAILQAPFFDPNADDAVNYGGIGAVIGHEITHHFDDQGRKYDKTGRLADWWTAEDVKRFKEGTDKVVAQYGAYEPVAGKKVNGELTLGENIADLAGITIAYDSWKRSLGGKKPKAIGGFTGDQRFFLGFSQVWRQKYREPALLQQLVTDPHTPGHFRPYVVRNIDAWYKAFNVKQGEKMYLSPEERIKLW